MGGINLRAYTEISTADPVLGCYHRICAFRANKTQGQGQESAKASAISSVVIVSTFPDVLLEAAISIHPQFIPKQIQAGSPDCGM